MNIGIYALEEKYLSLNELEKLTAFALLNGVTLFFNQKYINNLNNINDLNNINNFKSYSNNESILNSISYMISYGGDGTFLKCVREVGEKQIPILGINSGTLGFLLSMQAKNGVDALNAIINNDFKIETRNMISVKGFFDGKQREINGFNEFTLQKSGLNMITIELKIDGNKITTYNADGLVISTPSGSTAYSMSLGGPIVSPGCNCFIIIPIAPHNLTMRPLIVEDSSEITLKVYSRIDPSFATVDNMSFKAYNDYEYSISLSLVNAKIIKLKNDSYYDILTKKMMWGLER